MNDESYERQLREKAAALGVQICTAPRKRGLDNEGGYQLVNSHNKILAGINYELSLVELELAIEDIYQAASGKQLRRSEY